MSAAKMQDLIRLVAGNTNVQDANAVPAKASKDKAGKVVQGAWRTAIDKVNEDLAAVCTDRQIETIERIAVEAIEFESLESGFRASMRAHVAELHPSGDVGYATYNAIVRALRTHAGDYAAKAYRDAVRRLPGRGYLPATDEYQEQLGELPTAGKGKGEGIKGQTPAKWYAGVHRHLDEITERMAKVPRGSINAKVLGEFINAYRAMVKADAALKRAIAE